MKIYKTDIRAGSSNQSNATATVKCEPIFKWLATEARAISQRKQAVVSRCRNCLLSAVVEGLNDYSYIFLLGDRLFKIYYHITKIWLKQGFKVLNKYVFIFVRL